MKLGSPLEAWAFAAGAGATVAFTAALLAGRLSGKTTSVARGAMVMSLWVAILAPALAVAGGWAGLGLVPVSTPAEGDLAATPVAEGMPSRALPTPAWRSPLASGATDASGSAPPPPMSTVSTSPPRRPDLPKLVLAAWMAGALGSLAWLLVGITRIRRLRRSLRPCTDDRILRAADAVTESLRLRRRLRVSISSMVVAPVTVGLREPVVVVPPDLAANLDGDELRGILLHEGAHVARRDPLLGLLARLACTLHWLNPLAHLAARRLRELTEYAADQAVLLTRSVAPSRYASALVKIAERALQAPRIGYAGPAAVCTRGSLERRVQRLLARGEAADSPRSLRARAAAAVVTILGSVAVLLSSGSPTGIQEKTDPIRGIKGIESGFVSAGPQLKGGKALRPVTALDPDSHPTLRGRFVAGAPMGPASVVLFPSPQRQGLAGSPVDLGTGEDTVSFDGRVLDPDGKPLGGALVYAQNGGAAQTLVSWTLPPWRSLVPDPLVSADTGAVRVHGKATTDADGRFFVEGIPLPVEGFVRIVHPSYPALIVKATPDMVGEDAVDFGSIRLERGVSLQATVRDQEGRPVEGAWVGAHPALPEDPSSVWPPSEWPAPGDVRVARTDSSGRCRVEGLRPGRTTVAAFTETNPPEEALLTLPEEGGAEITLALRPGLTITVEVLDRKSLEPRPGARVDLALREAEGEGGPVRVPFPRPPAMASTLTDEEGIATFCGLDARDYIVTVVPDDWADHHRSTPPPFSVKAPVEGGGEVRVLLDPPVGLELRLIDAGKGTIVHGARLQATPIWKEYDKTGGFPHPVTAASKDGAEWVVVEGLRPGPWVIHAFAPDRLPVVTDVCRIAEGAPRQRLQVEMQPATADFAGRVVSAATGEPIAGAAVSSYEPISWLLDGQRRSTTTNSDGRYLLSRLLGEGFPLLVRVEATGYLPQEKRLDEERAVKIEEFRLVRAARIEGRLLTPKGHPPPRTRVFLLESKVRPDGKGFWKRIAVTGADGTFQFTELEPGAYTVFVSKEVTERIEVTEGGIAKVEMQSR